MVKFSLQLMAMIFGLLGFAGCVAAIAVLWSVNARVNRATGNAFDAIEDSMVVVQRQLAQTQARIGALKITTEDVQQSVKQWTETKSSERVGSPFEMEETTERLASGLRQADHLLEATESLMQFVQRILRVGTSINAPVHPETFQRSIEELASLRTELTQAIELVDTIQTRIAEPDGEDVDGKLINHVGQLAVRVIATLGSLDSRFAELGERLSEIQTKTRNVRVDSQRWIRLTAIGLTLLTAWMAVGQACARLSRLAGMEPSTNSASTGRCLISVFTQEGPQGGEQDALLSNHHLCSRAKEQVDSPQFAIGTNQKLAVDAELRANLFRRPFLNAGPAAETRRRACVHACSPSGSEPRKCSVICLLQFVCVA